VLNQSPQNAGDECNSSPGTENVLKHVDFGDRNVLQHVFCIRHRFQSVTLASNRFRIGIAENSSNSNLGKTKVII
jgi:hypothetical protein